MQQCSRSTSMSVCVPMQKPFPPMESHVRDRGPLGFGQPLGWSARARINSEIWGWEKFGVSWCRTDGGRGPTSYSLWTGSSSLSSSVSLSSPVPAELGYLVPTFCRLVRVFHFTTARRRPDVTHGPSGRAGAWVSLVPEGALCARRLTGAPANCSGGARTHACSRRGGEGGEKKKAAYGTW